LKFLFVSFIDKHIDNNNLLHSRKNVNINTNKRKSLIWSKRILVMIFTWIYAVSSSCKLRAICRRFVSYSPRLWSWNRNIM